MFELEESILESNLSHPVEQQGGGHKFLVSSSVSVGAMMFASLLFSVHDGMSYRLTSINNAPKIAQTMPVQPSSVIEDSRVQLTTKRLENVSLPQQLAQNTLVKNETTEQFGGDVSGRTLSEPNASVALLDTNDTFSSGVDEDKPFALVRVSMGKGSSQSQSASLDARRVSVNTKEHFVYRNLLADERDIRSWLPAQTQRSDYPELTNIARRVTHDPIEDISSKTPINSKPAEVLHSPKPKYPNIAVRKLLEAQVQVSFVVTASGEVGGIEFGQKTNKHFVRSIRRTLKKWRFEPAMVNGKYVNSTVTETFSFTEPEKRLLYITGTRFPKVLKESYLPKDYRT